MLFATFATISCETFVPGKRVRSRSARSGRALLQAAATCTAANNQQSFCNGDPDPICNAKGFLVNNLLLKLSNVLINFLLNSSAQEIRKALM